MGYSFRLAARVLSYAPSHRQDSTYHCLLLHQLWSTGWNEKLLNGSTMRDGEADLSHHEGKEGNVLFNDALNTFYLRLYGVRHMVKDHSDSEKGNLLPPHRLLFPISSKGSFICTIPHTGWHIPRPLLTSRGALAGTRNSSMGPPHEGLIQQPIAPWANALTTELHLAPYHEGMLSHGTVMLQPVWL